MLAASGWAIAAELSSTCPPGGPLSFGQCALRPVAPQVVGLGAGLYVVGLSAVAAWVSRLRRRRLGDPAGARKYWQGDIGTQGLHVELIVDSDNAAQTFPIDEVDSEQRMVVLQGNPGNVGDKFGRSVDVPLVIFARPFA